MSNQSIKQAGSSFGGGVGATGTLGVKKISPPRASLAWRIENAKRPAYLFGRFTNWVAKGFSSFTGIPTLTSELSIKHFKVDGSIIDYGVVSYRVVTTAFVDFMVDQMQAETAEWGDFKFHDSGVGVTAAAIGDTDIETTDAEARDTGTQAEGASSNIYRSVGTISYTSTLAITEHGLFSIITGGTLLDRHVFSAVNVVNGDSIQFTYDLTVSSGG